MAKTRWRIDGAAGKSQDKQAGRSFITRGERPSLRRLPTIESLEQRWLPSLTVQFANGVGAVGAGSVDVESNAVTDDSAGNVLITGSLQGTANFGTGVTTLNLSSTGNRDVFIAKYAKTGSLLWAKDLRGGDALSVAQGAAITVDGSGNVLVSGTFTGTVNFDPGAGNTSFTASGRNDVFIAKYDSSGNLLWARDVVGTAGTVDEGYALAVDSIGDVWATGSYQSSATFGATTLNATGQFEQFVTKLNPSGQFLWATTTTGSGSSVAQGAGITVDGSGNAVATGFYAGTVDFNPSGGNTLPVASARAIFVQKLDGNGNLVWAQGIVGDDINQGNSVIADPSGNLYVTGTFTGAVNFDAGAGSTVITAGGYEDPFLMKLNSAGKLLWAKDMALTGFNFGQGTGVAIDGFGNVFAAGYFAGVMTLDPTAAGAILTSAGGFDIFTAEYDGSGNFVAATSSGGAGFDAGFGIGVNGAGLVAIAGRYTGPATFGSVTLPAQSSKSIFVEQISSFQVSAPPVAPSTPVLETASDSGLSNSDGITKVTSPVFDVTTAVAGNLVELLRDGLVVGSRVGPGAITDAGPVPNGAHVYKARQTDGFSQTSPFSTTLSVTTDTVAPNAPGALSINAADDSGIKGDGITNLKQPRLTGVADATSFVQLLDTGNNVVASTTSAADGTFTLTPPSLLNDGTYSYKVREEDVAGNFSASSPTLTVTILATAPAAPSTPSLLAADDSGTLGDGVTNVKQPHLIGNGAKSTTVQLLNPAGTVLGSGSVDGSGNYSVIPSSPLTDGTYAIRARSVDVAGNIGAASAAFSITIQSGAPGTPSAPTILSADDSGLKGDGITNVNHPRFTGTAVGATVQLLNGTQGVLATATIVSGSYTITYPNPLADGSYPVSIRVVDSFGNLSSVSTPFTMVIDTTAPAAPSTPVLLSADDSGAKGDGFTNVKQPHFTGTADANTTIQLVNASNSVIGTAVATGGAYAVVPNSNFSDGTYTFKVQAIDVAGNVSVLSGPVTVSIDATAPAPPSTPTLFAADDSGVTGDGITSVKQPRLTGASEVSATLQWLNSANVVVGTAVVAGNGTFTIAPSSALADGTYVLHLQATDNVGNVSASSGTFTLIVDTTAPSAPSAPTLLSADDSGVKGDGITNATSPHLVGTTVANTAVQLFNGLGTVIGLGTSDASGNYSIVPTSAPGDGSYALTVKATDAAGNVSAASGSLTLVIDTVAPSAPSTPSLLPADDSGTLGDGTTNVRQPHLIGTTVAGMTVQIVNGFGTVLGTDALTQGGAYSVLIANPLSDGIYSLRAQAIDAAGNLGPASAAFTLTIASSSNLPAAPSAPSLFSGDDSAAKGDGITNVNQPRMTGVGTVGTSVQLVIAGGVAGVAPVGQDGTYTVAFASPLADGTYSVAARTLDNLNNLSAESSVTTLTILTTAPAAPSTPVLDPAADSGKKGDNITNITNPRVDGTSAPGLTVQLLDGSGNVLGWATATVNGNYTVGPFSQLPEGLSTLSVRAVDMAGNIGPASGTLQITVESIPPGTPSTPVLIPADDTGVKGDNITRVNLPRLQGTASPGATVQLLDAGGNVLGSATTGIDGTYLVTPSSPLRDGVNVFKSQALDAAGNVSGTSATLSLTVITTPPSAPGALILNPADDSGVKGDGITNVKQPRFTGTAPLSMTVQLVNPAGTVLGTTAVAGDGTFSLSPGSALADGSSKYSARLIDVAGNVSNTGPALLLTIDTKAPIASAPVLLPADDSGVLGDGITNFRQPHFLGTSEAGATVVLINGSGTTVATATADANGKYALQPAPLADGSYAFKVQAIDAAGNVGTLTSPANVTILATTPAAPSTPILLAADDTAPVGDSKTANRRPGVIGTTLLGAAVDLLDATGNVIGSTTASTLNGSYTIQPSASLAAGSLTLRVRVRDVAGNLSTAGSALALTIVDATAGDFNGDGRTDLSIFRPSTAQWIIRGSGDSATSSISFGSTNLTSIPVPADYDGTGHSQLAIFQVSTGQWFISEANGVRIVSFGGTGLSDIPVPGDYDGVGYAEPAVFRPSTGQWFVLGPNGGHVFATFGGKNLTDIPVPGDYDGIGRTEPAVFRPSTGQWFVLGPNGGRVAGTWGALNLFDIPAPGDYDGLGHTELAVFRPSTAQWFVLAPSGGKVLATYGATSLFDYPTTTSVGSLKKLGKAGSIRIASLAIPSASDSGPAALAPMEPVAASPVAIKPVIRQVTRKVQPQPVRRDLVLGEALNSLLEERVRRGR